MKSYGVYKSQTPSQNYVAGFQFSGWHVYSHHIEYDWDNYIAIHLFVFSFFLDFLFKKFLATVWSAFAKCWVQFWELQLSIFHTEQGKFIEYNCNEPVFRFSYWEDKLQSFFFLFP